MRTIQSMCVQVDMNLVTPTPPQMTRVRVLLRVSACVHVLHRAAFSQRSFYTEELLHSEACTFRGFDAEKSFTQRSFYAQKLFTQKNLNTEELLHKEVGTQRNFHKHKLLHTEDILHRSF